MFKMSSKLQHGTLLVHNEQKIDEILLDAKDPNNNITTMTSRSHSQQNRRQMSTPNANSRNSTVDSKSLIGHSLKIQDWLNDKTVKELQGRADIETRSARKLYGPILQEENTFVKEIEDYLNYTQCLGIRKKEMLHKKWNERIYDPLQRKVQNIMDDCDWLELDRRKRSMHKQYLEFVNKKGHVFLDTIDPEEYYAMALTGHRPAPIKVRVGAVRDPLLSQGQDRTEEDRTILRCMTGITYSDQDVEQVRLPPVPLVPLGRHDGNSLSWVEMPLNNIESSARLASRRRMRGTSNRSQVNFEAWVNTPFDPKLVDKEMQTQKKRLYSEKPPYGLPPRPPSPIDHFAFKPQVAAPATAYNSIGCR